MSSSMDRPTPTTQTIEEDEDEDLKRACLGTFLAIRSRLSFMKRPQNKLIELKALLLIALLERKHLLMSPLMTHLIRESRRNISRSFAPFPIKRHPSLSSENCILIKSANAHTTNCYI